MASKYERMTDLYFQTLNEMLEPENWSCFLTTACRNFRLSFHEQVMLYAQKPDVTAVLPIEGRNGWNRRFGRWVNRGAKGIAMFDGQSGLILRTPTKAPKPNRFPSGRFTRKMWMR